MNVLISWSGERSKNMASMLNNWIPKVIQIAQPWMSDEDIATGARWSAELNQILEKTAVGIICVTPENQQSAWLHFEAGALSKSISDSKVIPLLLEMTPIQLTGPMAQFQAVECKKEGIRKVLISINKSLEGSVLKEDDLTEIFEVWWPKLKSELENMDSYNEVIVKRDNSDMLEEVLEILREQKREHKEDVTRFVDSKKADLNKMTDQFNVMLNSLDNSSKDRASLEKLKLAYLSKSGKSNNSEKLPQELIDLIDKQTNIGPIKDLMSVLGTVQESMFNGLEEIKENDENDENDKNNNQV